MAKYAIDESTLKNLANAIRKVNGETKSYTPTEMIEAVTNIMESATYILVDEAGNEVPAVYVDSEMIFTATPNDIRIGTTAVNNDGVVEGEKEIPAYHTHQGYRVITPGSAVRHFDAPSYEYTKLQALVCAFNSSPANSTSTEKVAIDDQVYAVQSVEPMATVTINHTDKAIEFGITNESTKPQILRYFYYKEEL